MLNSATRSENSSQKSVCEHPDSLNGHREFKTGHTVGDRLTGIVVTLAVIIIGVPAVLIGSIVSFKGTIFAVLLITTIVLLWPSSRR